MDINSSTSGGEPKAPAPNVETKSGAGNASAVAAAISIALGLTSAATSNFGPAAPPLPVAVPPIVAPFVFPSADPCPNDGDGGDPGLNQQKNRFTEPGDTDMSSTIRYPSDVIALPEPPGTGRQSRDSWSDGDAATIGGYEATGATIEGKIVRITPENKPKGESVNCHRYKTLYDYHIFVADTPDVGIDQAVVVEMTPRWRSVEPTWTVPAIRKLIKNQTPVRVTGWLMYDEEHTDQVGKYRATAWELHPVTRLQYQTSDGSWVTL